MIETTKGYGEPLAVAAFFVAIIFVGFGLIWLGA